MDVVVTNPSLSAGQKLGIAALAVIFFVVVYIIYFMGAPRR